MAPRPRSADGRKRVPDNAPGRGPSSGNLLFPAPPLEDRERAAKSARRRNGASAAWHSPRFAAEPRCESEKSLVGADRELAVLADVHTFDPRLGVAVVLLAARAAQDAARHAIGRHPAHHCLLVVWAAGEAE